MSPHQPPLSVFRTNLLTISNPNSPLHLFSFLLKNTPFSSLISNFKFHHHQMEMKEMVKVEEGPTQYSTDPLTNYMLDLGDPAADKKSSLGFMELLGIQDFNTSSIFDMLQPSDLVTQKTSTPPAESSEVLNNPATPYSPSVSSVSNGAELSKRVDEQEGKQQQQTKQQ